jgi:hypothetical protein
MGASCRENAPQNSDTYLFSPFLLLIAKEKIDKKIMIS